MIKVLLIASLMMNFILLIHNYKLTKEIEMDDLIIDRAKKLLEKIISEEQKGGAE